MNKSNYKISNRGFTLVELMVVISIFVIITTVTIFNYGDFRSNVSLQNLTDDIALSIRKAQGFAVGARGISIGSNTVFTNSYGVHFSIDKNPVDVLDGSNKSFLIFASSDKYYDSSSSNTCVYGALNECVELFNITSNDEISEIWLKTNDNGASLEKKNPNSSLDVVFTRPDTKATFCYREAASPSCNISDISEVKIVISNGQTDASKKKTKSIYIQNTGQISIE